MLEKPHIISGIGHFYYGITKDKRDGSLYLRLCQPMRQTLKTIRLLRQEAERRIEMVIAKMQR